jgi:DNA (cytosine-5)-methyltransferase 1
MASYYNEFCPTAAAWLRQLIADKQIPYGHVDDRSITEVTPSDLRGFTQAHWFAGVAGWPLALRLAGWPDDRPVWTASLPCQPFSSAGKQAGTDDERHLAPVFLRLVRECRPPVCLGEQVASKIARDQWLPGVCLEFQAMGYPITAVDICAPSAGEIGEGRLVRGGQETWEPIVIGAPHIRQRLYWVAYRGMGDSASTRLEGSAGEVLQTGGSRPSSTGADHRMAQPRNVGAGSQPRQACGLGGQPVDTGAAGLRQDHGTACPGGADPRGASSDTPDRMADTPSDRRERAGQGAETEEGRQPRLELGGELPCGSEGRGLHHWKRVSFAADCLGGDDEEFGDECSICGLTYAGDCECPGPTQDGYEYEEFDGELYARWVGDTGSEGSQGLTGNVGDGGEPGRQHPQQARPAWAASWTDFDLVPCRDGKARRTERSVKPLVAGLPRGVVPSCDPGAPGYANETSEARVMRLKGYGNSIVAPLAAMFIETCMEVIPHE